MAVAITFKGPFDLYIAELQREDTDMPETPLKREWPVIDLQDHFRVLRDGRSRRKKKTDLPPRRDHSFNSALIKVPSKHLFGKIRKLCSKRKIPQLPFFSLPGQHLSISQHICLQRGIKRRLHSPASPIIA